MRHQTDARPADQDDRFPTDPAGLPEATATTRLTMADGDASELRIAPVAKRLGDTTLRMLAYNGSIPGPQFDVRQGSEVSVTVINEGDVEATVHWHGLRLDNRFDGVPYETQAPIPIGGSFTYQVRFPDPGLYWYHPHVREDYTQEMGLYGAIVVVPADPDHWPPADREVVLTLDDILLEGGRVAAFSRSRTTHAAMGRYGTRLLVAGEPEPALTARAGEVVRLHLVNTANTRVFNVGLPGARMKLVGGDSGRYEREQFVREVLLAPSERAVVDVLFDRPGVVPLQHRSPRRSWVMATFTVTGDRAVPSSRRFDLLRADPGLQEERRQLGAALTRPPDKTLALVAEMDDPAGETDEPSRYACPMHPEVVSDRPGRCPECGMKLLRVPAEGAQSAHGHHATPDGTGDGIEWEDDMAEVNPLTTSDNTRWKLVDRDTGAENAAIDWHFRVGQRVKIRLVNEMDSDHPMHHPFHVHGAGRFLVLTRDGAVEPNLVRKDTVLVRTGQTVDILLDVDNPGRWMAHCHIAEHMQSGMMFSFQVDPG